MTARPEPDLSTVGKRLAYARLCAGLNQRELAHMIGKRQSAVSTYEADQGGNKLGRLLEFAKALNVDPCWLAFGDPE